MLKDQMRKRLTLMCVFFCCLGMARTICAQAQAKAEQVCSPAMLDVSALPGPPSFTYGAHLFVLEVQNISRSACTLPPIEPTHVFLLPVRMPTTSPTIRRCNPAILGTRRNPIRKYSLPALGHMFSLCGPHVLLRNKVVTYTPAFVSVFLSSGNYGTSQESKSVISGYGRVARLL